MKIMLVLREMFFSSYILLFTNKGEFILKVERYFGEIDRIIGKKLELIFYA